jgi:hypothetical protein
MIILGSSSNHVFDSRHLHHLSVLQVRCSQVRTTYIQEKYRMKRDSFSFYFAL